VAGAVFVRPLAAQDTSRVRRDTVLRITVPSRADSLRIRDSLARDSAIKADTIKAPIARAEMPPLIGIASPFRWNRAELFASGALTVQDLLDRMPGVTTMRSGWIASPSVGAFEGDVRRVRVFIDGVERDAIDPRSDGVLDLTQIALWSFEEPRSSAARARCAFTCELGA